MRIQFIFAGDAMLLGEKAGGTDRLKSQYVKAKVNILNARAREKPKSHSEKSARNLPPIIFQWDLGSQVPELLLEMVC